MPVSQLTRQESLSQQLKLKEFRTSTSLRLELIRFQLSILSTHRATDQEAALLKTDSVQLTLALGWEVARVCVQDPVLVVLLSSDKVDNMVEIALAAKTGHKDTLRLSRTIKKDTLLIMVDSRPSQPSMEVSMDKCQTSMEVHMEEPCSRHSITDSPLQQISSSQTMTLTGPSTSKVSIKTLSMEVALTLGSKR